MLIFFDSWRQTTSPLYPIMVVSSSSQLTICLASSGLWALQMRLKFGQNAFSFATPTRKPS